VTAHYLGPSEMSLHSKMGLTEKRRKVGGVEVAMGGEVVIRQVFVELFWLGRVHADGPKGRPVSSTRRCSTRGPYLSGSKGEESYELSRLLIH